jgi:hypothetical protein
MQTTGQLQRQSLGCGYEPPADGRVRLAVWQPPGGNRGYRGPDLTICAGYTTKLNEANEAWHARAHWKNGALVPACLGDEPTEDLLTSILILDGGYNALESWAHTPASEGGGGK